MKRLNSYNFFLINERGTSGRTTGLKKEEFQKLLSENCTYWEQNKEKKLWRGLTSEYEFGYINPMNDVRSSIETEQIHVTYLSDSEDWKDFPKYQNSVIGATKVDGAKGYGTKTFEVIPYDNARIVFCPKSSIWASLGGWGDNNGIKLISNFLYSIGIMYSYQADWYYTEGKIMDIGIFTRHEYDGSIDSDLRIIDSDSYGTFMDKMVDWIGERDLYTGEDVLNFIAHTFSPEDFTIVNYDDKWVDFHNMNNEVMDDHPEFGKGLGKQFWTDSECLLVMRDV